MLSALASGLLGAVLLVTLPPRLLLRVPGYRAARRAYCKAEGRSRCIVAILRGDAVIFGATVRGAKVEAGNAYLNVGIGDLTVVESTIERCQVTATGTRLGFGDKIVSNYFRRPGEPERTVDALRVS